MPIMETYLAEVTVSVVLKSTSSGKLAEYSVTRRSEGFSAEPGEGLEKQRGAEKVIDAALVNAVAANKALAAGVQNAERRRLK